MNRRGIASACVKLKFVATPFMTNHNFTDEDFEEWGPNAGLTPDSISKYLDANFSAAALSDDAHLCYIEQQPAPDAALPRTALGVTDGALEWSIGAIDATADRSAIIGSPAVIAQTPAAYADWSSLYIANRESSTSLTLFKRTHLKDTDTAASVTSPKPALNLFLCARNNAGVADQHFKNRLRFLHRPINGGGRSHRLLPNRSSFAGFLGQGSMMEMKMARLILAFVALIITGCASKRYPAGFPAHLKPVIESQLQDSKRYKVDSFSEEKDRWRISVTFPPPTPGGHCTIEISKTNNAVLRVIPGA